LTNELRKLNLSWQESQLALSYKIISGVGATIFYSDIKQANSKESYSYSLELEAQLAMSIRRGDLAQSKEFIDEIFRQPCWTVKDAMHFLFNFSEAMLKILDEFCLSDIADDDFDPRTRLQSATTMPEMKKTALEALDPICHHIQTCKKSHNTDLKDRILEFIEKNYMNEEISVQQICDYVNISSSYLSRFFKEHMGENLKDYILRARIKNAIVSRFYTVPTNFRKLPSR
jgi:YesN/AraC family two-component response regulator